MVNSLGGFSRASTREFTSPRPRGRVNLKPGPKCLPGLSRDPSAYHSRAIAASLLLRFYSQNSHHSCPCVDGKDPYFILMGGVNLLWVMLPAHHRSDRTPSTSPAPRSAPGIHHRSFEIPPKHGVLMADGRLVRLALPTWMGPHLDSDSDSDR